MALFSQAQVLYAGSVVAASDIVSLVLSSESGAKDQMELDIRGHGYQMGAAVEIRLFAAQSLFKGQVVSVALSAAPGRFMLRAFAAHPIPPIDHYPVSPNGPLLSRYVGSQGPEMGRIPDPHIRAMETRAIHVRAVDYPPPRDPNAFYNPSYTDLVRQGRAGTYKLSVSLSMSDHEPPMGRTYAVGQLWSLNIPQRHVIVGQIRSIRRRRGAVNDMSMHMFER